MLAAATRQVCTCANVNANSDNLPFTEASSSSPPRIEVLQSTNSLAPREPYRVPLDAIHSAPQLEPGEEVQLPFILHAAHHGEKDLSLLFVFREVCTVRVHHRPVHWLRAA